jgi:capsular polysaccharide biosynthesis protein
MFGLMLGLGLALLAELLDRRVRNRDDLAALLQVPVLGEINWLGRSGRQTGFLPASFTRRLSAS